MMVPVEGLTWRDLHAQPTLTTRRTSARLGRACNTLRGPRAPMSTPFGYPGSAPGSTPGLAPAAGGPQGRPDRCEDDSVNRLRRWFRHLREGRRSNVSPRLDALVHGWVQRSYLKTDGWWADLLLERFDFLRDYGFEVDQVVFRIQEHTLGFESDRYRVNFLYSRDGECGNLIIPADGGRPFGIGEVIEQQLPELPRPPLEPFGRATVTARIDYWATGLRQLAPALFGDEPMGTVDARG